MTAEHEELASTEASGMEGLAEARAKVNVMRGLSTLLTWHDTLTEARDGIDAGIATIRQLSRDLEEARRALREIQHEVSPERIAECGSADEWVRRTARRALSPQTEDRCGEVVKPFRANCMLPKGHHGPHAVGGVDPLAPERKP